jgi:hypothetical protein
MKALDNRSGPRDHENNKRALERDENNSIRVYGLALVDYLSTCR